MSSELRERVPWSRVPETWRRSLLRRSLAAVAAALSLPAGAGGAGQPAELEALWAAAQPPAEQLSSVQVGDVFRSTTTGWEPVARGCLTPLREEQLPRGSLRQQQRAGAVWEAEPAGLQLSFKRSSLRWTSSADSILTEDCADQLAEEHYDTPATELLLVEETLQGEPRRCSVSEGEGEGEAGGVCARLAGQRVSLRYRLRDLGESQPLATAKREARERLRLQPPDFMPMVTLKAGSVELGCTQETDPDCSPKSPRRSVTVPRDFWLGTTEVTQGQWHEIFPQTELPSEPERPRDWVGFLDVARYANQLSERHELEPCYLIEGYRLSWPDGLDCEGYRLPTEAEWEYAARAGEEHLYSGGPDIAEVGWYGSPGLMSAMDPEAPPPGNAEDSSHPVGLLKPNAWGLYDMSGNLAEWAWRLEDEEDQLVPADTREQILRGGHWASYSRAARVHTRWGEDIHAKGNTTGFRLARTAPEP